MKRLIATTALILASGVSLAANPDLYSEGNFSFQNESDRMTHGIAHIDPVGTETLYQEGNFPTVEKNPTEHHGIVHQDVPSDLYKEGNFSA